MKKNFQFSLSKDVIYIIALISIGFCLGIGYLQLSKKAKLDSYYFDRFKDVKSRMINGSSIDTKKELDDYEDQTELYMHLDGYDGVEILDMRVKAGIDAAREKKDRPPLESFWE